MIVKDKREELSNVKGKSVGAFEGYIDEARRMRKNWKDTVAVADDMCPANLTEDLCIAYRDRNNVAYREDISEYAFSQLCSKVGLPASYVQKCFKAGKGDLAVYNFKDWSNEMQGEQNLLVRSYNGVARAVLSDRYNVFDTASVMEGIQDAVEAHSGRYELNQIFLSEDKLHMRFVDFNNPIKAGREKLTPGFTVSSSDVGSGSLNIKYFLYRFACRNGIVVSRAGGTLFRQTHLTDFESIKATIFTDALASIDKMNAYAEEKIQKAYDRRLNVEEMEAYIEKARRELHLGKSADSLIETLNEKYPEGNLLAFIHAITEDAQRYTLETRIEHETWAGSLLLKA